MKYDYVASNHYDNTKQTFQICITVVSQFWLKILTSPPFTSTAGSTAYLVWHILTPDALPGNLERFCVSPLGLEKGSFSCQANALSHFSMVSLLFKQGFENDS